MRKTPFKFGECCQIQMTVGDLRNALDEYPSDTPVYIESENSHIKGDTNWAQQLLDSYCCEDKSTKRKALMLVGDIT